MGIGEITVRLFRKAAAAKKLLILSTLSSIFNNICHVLLMMFGSCTVLFCFGKLGGSLRGWLTGMLLSAIGIFIFRYGEGVISHTAAYFLLADMRVKLYRQLRRLAPACLVDRKKGDLLSIAVGDIETIERFFAHTIGPLFIVILLPVMTIVFAFIVHPLFGWILIPIYLVVSVIIPLLSLKSGRNIGMRYRSELGQLKTLTLESVQGIRDIQIFRYGQRQKEKIMAKSKEINRSAHAMIMYNQIVTSLPTFFIYLARLSIVLCALWLGARQELNSSMAIMLSFIVSASFSSTSSLMGVMSSLIETYASAERVFTIEDTVPQISDPEEPETLDRIKDIAFDNVSFAYDRKTGDVLKDINVRIGEKEKVGIVGFSGSGKSTFLRLLLRFWNPDNGSISVNGIPIEKYSVKSIYSRIAELEQDTFLFNDTIRANIAIGKDGASDEEIEEAAKKAGIHELIMTLPDGYETQMGEMGDRLSGGEKQRIGIARVILRDPDVLVMDEPTSNLDILNEQSLLYTLKESCEDKMIIIVSHRTSTLTDCSRIFRIQGGEMYEVDQI
ncbi:MAG: ABC transporter ATP-binding protein [Firmicutes bacterium]|nr:ABC transporter ATP-binding protein [Bacillota bacterium]